MSHTDCDGADVTVIIGDMERALGVGFSPDAYLKVRDSLVRAMPKPTPAETAEPPTGNYLETATLRCADALAVVAEAWHDAGHDLDALRLSNLACQVEEVAYAESARRRADKEAAGVAAKPFDRAFARMLAQGNESVAAAEAAQAKEKRHA